MFGLHNSTGVPHKVISECKFSVRWFSAGGHWNASLCNETLICRCRPCLLSTSDLLTTSLLFLAADYQLLNTEVSLNAPHMEFHNSSCLPNQHRSIRKWHKHKHTLSTKKENRHEPNCKYFHAECGVFNMRRVFVQSMNTTVIYVCFQCSLSISKSPSKCGQEVWSLFILNNFTAGHPPNTFLIIRFIKHFSQHFDTENAGKVTMIIDEVTAPERLLQRDTWQELSGNYPAVHEGLKCSKWPAGGNIYPPCASSQTRNHHVSADTVDFPLYRFII